MSVLRRTNRLQAFNQEIEEKNSSCADLAPIATAPTVAPASAGESGGGRRGYVGGGGKAAVVSAAAAPGVGTKQPLAATWAR